jgi:hypothetical protein
VGDEDDGHAHLLLQAAHEVEDLSLDGDIERGGRFVGNDEGWSAGKGEGDDDALAHAAGELVRVVHHALFRSRNAHEFQHLGGGVPSVPL